jgi:catechol 2,3-dioxygenase
VRLRVADQSALAAFYGRVVGLRELDRDDGVVALGVEGGEPLVELLAAPGAPPRPPRSPGLFHLALLVPGRADLARALRRVADAGWRLTGASDHLVSEALYLRDPEGNGIELYRDRPRAEWPRIGDEIEMATLPLDLESLLAEPGSDEAAPAMPDGTTMGHVHLEVGDLTAAEPFYSGELGMDVVVRSYPGALFLSYGGYHHHVGLNTWLAAGSPPPPADSLGLAHYELRGEGVVERELTDPAGNTVRVLPSQP